MYLALDRYAARFRFATLVGICAAILVPGPSHGQSPAPGASQWQSIEHAQMRLIAAQDSLGGGRDVEIGLHVRLDPGWHTYWRAAGGVGFPPQMDWSDSANLAHLEVMWPSPRRIFTFGYEAVGYENEVVFPMRATLARAGAPLKLRLDAMIAVCRDICIPFDTMLALDLPVGSAAATPYAQLIERYTARVPTRQDVSGFAIVSARLVRRGPGMAIEIAARADPHFDTPDLFVETRPGIVLGPQEKKSASDGWFEVTVPFGQGSAGPLREERLTVTLIDRTRAIERVLVATSAR